LTKRNVHHRRIVEKIGKSNVVVCKMDCASEAFAFELEKTMIAVCKSRGLKLANMTDGGEGISNPAEEVRNKISAALSNPSEETRRKIGAAHKGKFVSEETRKKIAEANKRRTPPMLGRKHSEESKEKMSSSSIGRKMSDETRKKMSVSQRKRFSSAK